MIIKKTRKNITGKNVTGKNATGKNVTGKIISIILSLALLCLNFCVPDISYAAGGAKGISVQYHTQEEIKSYLGGINTNFTAVYSEQPQTSVPYLPGALSEQTQQNAIDILNACRYIAGIDADVAKKEDYVNLAQHAALVNAANKQLSHFPTQPAGMDDTTYNLGKEGAGESNLGYTSWVSTMGYNIISGWMEDSDAYNIDCVGHRRWVLNPSMQYTGFGMAVNGTATYSAMYSFDQSRRGTTYYGVSWPAQNMPVEFFGDKYAWSISMGKSIDTGSVNVTLTRASDGKIWTFSSLSADGFFNVENSYYGQMGCIIFRPDGVTYSSGDSFSVEITGTGLDVAYDVNFFSVSSSVTPSTPLTPAPSSPTPVQSPSPTPALPSQSPVPSSPTPVQSPGPSSPTPVQSPGPSSPAPVQSPLPMLPSQSPTPSSPSRSPLPSASPASCIHEETVIQGKKDATCTVNGYTGNTVCKKCGAVVLSGKNIPALGHKAVTDPAVAPTLTTAGKTAGSHCSVCNTILVAQVVIPATGTSSGGTGGNSAAGEKVETTETTSVNSAGNEVTTTTTVTTSATGDVTTVTVNTIENVASNTSVVVTATEEKGKTTAKAEIKSVNSGKVTISDGVMSQIEEASGVNSVKTSFSVYKDKEAVTSTAGNSSKPLYTITFSSNLMKSDSAVKMYQVRGGKYYILDNKTYAKNKDGALEIKIGNTSGNTYKLVDETTAKKIVKKVSSAIKVAKSSITVKKGKTANVKLASSYALSSVKSMKYTSSNKKVLTVDQSGKIKTGKSGNATVRVKVTLKDGTIKNVSAKITVK